MKVIEVENVSFGYHALPVLEEVSFSVEEGEFIALFGPNGGGKTTLLNLLMGFLKPSRGKISLFGKSPKKEQKKIGLVPQSFLFDKAFPISVEEVVLAGRLSHSKWYGGYTKTDRVKAQESLEQVGLKGFSEAPFSALSGGQQQRVLIARALASDPALLLLDEPTASIDITAEVEILKMLRDLKKKMTILMVTHELKLAVDQVDRLLCVQKTVSPMSHEKVCEHYALGLYHPPERNS